MMKKMKIPHIVRGILLCSFVMFFLPLSAQVLSVVISEVMYKPDPAVGLPECEYVELYNRSDTEVFLDGWRLMVGRQLKLLPSCRMQPRSCLLLAAASDTAVLSVFGPVAALSSLSLNNSGQRLALLDASGRTLFSFSYRHEWQVPEKRTGGWSLEMSDPGLPCVEKGNWISSEDLSGGTPGRFTPSSAAIPHEPVRLLRVVSEGERDVKLFFSGKLHPDCIGMSGAFIVDGMVPADSMPELGPDWNWVRLRIPFALQAGERHLLHAAAPLCDCSGAPVESAAVPFGLSETADSLDLVVNELLFHPDAGGSAFVEIYNRSGKIVDLRYLRLTSHKKDGSLDTGRLVAPDGWPLFPGGYLFITANPDAVCTRYDCAAENGVEMPDFPSYAHGAGEVVLLDRGRVLDGFSYSESMHYPLLASAEGVSLERISPDVGTRRAENWCSAASVSGYATPGRPNSCLSYGDAPETEGLWLENALFSPDGDGYADRMLARYRMAEASMRGSAWVYHPDGTRVRTLLNNELLAAEGMIVWDGVQDNGCIAPTGAYVLLFEYWSLSGRVKRIRRVVTVARRW